MEHRFKDFGAFIKKERRAKNHTQQDVADALGVSVQSVSQWETGRTQPEFQRIIALGNLLGVDLASFGLRDGVPKIAPPRVAMKAEVLATLTAYVREHGKREGLLDALLPPERQEEGIARAMGLIEYLSREEPR